jgi:hypothetical protein
MATATFFHSFLEALAEKKHNLGSDQFTVALTNTAPSASADAVLADLPTEISYTFCSSRNLTIASSTHSNGTYSWTLSDLTLTASGGPVGPFRYVSVYNNTAASDELVCFVDRGSSVTLEDTNTITLDMSGALLTLAYPV